MKSYKEYNNEYDGFIYETVCTVNGRRYIGRKGRDHNPDDPDDSWYLGSPTNPQFWEDIEKYGRDKFRREMLDAGPLTFEESIEKELYYQKLNEVDKNPVYYNLSIWSSCSSQTGEDNPMWNKTYVTNGDEEIPIRVEELPKYEFLGYHLGRKDSVVRACREANIGKLVSEETRNKMSEAWSYDAHITEAWKEKQSLRMSTSENPMKHPDIAKKMSETIKGEGNPFYGRTHSEKYKNRLKEEYSGKGNPCYGKKLMNNGVSQKYILESLIPEYEALGWIIGKLRK